MPPKTASSPKKSNELYAPLFAIWSRYSGSDKNGSQWHITVLFRSPPLSVITRNRVSAQCSKPGWCIVIAACVSFCAIAAAASERMERSEAELTMPISPIKPQRTPVSPMPSRISLINNGGKRINIKFCNFRRNGLILIGPCTAQNVNAAFF